MSHGYQITLVSSEGAAFLVDSEVVKASQVLKNLMEDLPADEVAGSEIPISEVSEVVLQKVLQWCSFHHAASSSPVVRAAWDDQFMQVDVKMLFDLLCAANFLEIPELMDLACKTVANMIKGKNAEEIRAAFNVQNDFSPEKEEEIRRENQWVQDR